MTMYKKTMREALQEVSSYKIKEEVELEEAMSKDMALKILSMAKNQDFKIASGDRAPMIYLSNDDRDELKKEFGRLGRDVPGPNKGATVMQIVNLAYSGNDRKPFDTEGGKHMISWDKGGKKIGTPKKVSDAAKLAGLKLEEVELDEAKMSSKQIAALKKAYEPMRGGRLSMDNATKLGNLMDRFDKDKDLLIQLFKADIPFVSKIAMTRLISKHKMKGAELNKLADKDEFYRKMYGESLDEDGHADVASAIRQCKTVMEDAQQIMAKLQTMSPEDSLPTWWTNKFAVASNSMNKMRDYIVNPLGEALDEDSVEIRKEKN